MAEKLSIALAKEALLKLLNSLSEDKKLKEIKETCSNDMLQYIQAFLPYSIQVQTKIVAHYGFTEDNSGLIKFTNRLKELSLEDEEVASLFERFKSLLIPPLSVRSQCV